jgi:membrane-bound lytic murein transglycosylase D
MTTSFPRFIARTTLFVVFIALVALNVYGQSSARYIPTEQEKADLRLTNLIDKAETHFKNGKLELENNRREQARDQFDKAVDTILDSGLDVRSYPRLREYYVQLTERIYREEVPLQQVTPQQSVQNVQVAFNGQQETPQQPQIGFREQKFEPSPQDTLWSKLELTPEEQNNVSPQDVEDIEVAKNAVDFSFETNPLIQQFINYYQGRGRSTMESGLRRSGRFMKMARQIFKEEGVPEDIIWLGQVESAWIPKAYSSAAASGLWQFVPGTGRTYGLRQTAWVDERNSFEKATRASARYLKDLANHFNGDWNLAMAAYNTGQGNVDRAISRAGASSYWKIYPYIAQETKNYVPNILAVILIAKNPEKYGFRNISREPSMAYDVVQVPNSTSLQLIAKATDSTLDYVRSLNPELRRDTTPQGEAYQVRIPGGKAKQFVALLNKIPGNLRGAAIDIVSVAPGEDLEAVSRRTGISIAKLQELSGGSSAVPNKIVVPQNLVQPTGYFRPKPVEAAPVSGGVAMKVRARAGDTVAKIAERFNFSADVVARLNGVAADAELQSGQEIKLPSVSAAPSRRRGR